jgi:signal transduction histidine kinase
VTMNDLLDRLHRAAVAQRRFVADAAHELRSPLAALRARLEVSERGGDLGRWQRAAPVLVSDVDRLGRLVDDLLALARLDESPRLRRAVQVDLDEIVFAEVTRLRPGTGVVLDTRNVSAALLYGDPDLLSRVVANLLRNAVRHAAHRVQVSVTTSDGQVELTVADDGPGIPSAERERVFERFHRLDAARDRDGGGSGLGLAIVRDAVRAHQGSVSIQDDRPGAVVVVWLPQEQPPHDR